MADADWLYYLIGTLLAAIMPESVGLTFRRRREIGFRRASPARPEGRATFFSPTRSRNTCPVVTWRGIAGPLKVSAGSIRNITRPATTWTFAGACSRQVTTSRSVRLRLCGTTDASRSNAFRKQQEGLRRSGIDVAFQAPDFLWADRNGEMAWTDLRRAAVQLVHLTRPIIYHGIFGEGFFQSIYPTPQSEVAAYLSSIEWFALTIFLFGLGFFLPALRIVPYLMFGGTLCVAISYMLRARIEPSSIRSRRVCSSCSSPSRNHSFGDGRAISHGCISNARRAVSFARTRNCRRRRVARGNVRRLALLERRGEGPASIAHFGALGSGRRRMALFDRYRLERMGHTDLRKFLVEHRAANGDGISRRNESAHPRGASLSVRHHDRHHQSGDVKHSDLPAAQSIAYRFVERDPVRFVRDLSGASRAPFEIARRGIG